MHDIYCISYFVVFSFLKKCFSNWLHTLCVEIHRLKNTILDMKNLFLFACHV